MSPVSLVSLVVAELFCWLTMITQAAEAPAGYEDERGFHFGDEPLWSSDSEF